MPRTVGFLADELDARIAELLQLVADFEQNKASYQGGPGALSIKSLELSYELAFLRIFASWEEFLEEGFARLLCGYHRGAAGQEPLKPGETYSTTIPGAQARVLAGKNFVTWYVPSDVVGRCRRFFDSSNFETVIASATSILNDQSLVRHQIAHTQAHAKAQFDAMTMRLEGKRFPNSRPGKFLRLTRSDGRTWLEFLSSQLRNLANQIAR